MGELDSNFSINVNNEDQYETQTINGPLIRLKKDKIDIQVGLDFGTSATKVMFRRIGGRTAKVVDFQHNLPHYPNYCLPSLAAVDKNGHLLLGAEAAKYLIDYSWDTGFQRMKVIVAGNTDERFLDPITKEKFDNYSCECGIRDALSPEKLTAIYIAYVMKAIKNYIKLQDEFRNIEINFIFNVCLPIDHIQKKETKGVFENIFSWAERIEDEWQNQNKKFDLLEAAENLREKQIKTDTRVFAIPESVAQISSYLQSLQRRENLHAIIDFGAGTTDISIFNYSEITGDSTTWWFAAKNVPCGTINVERVLSKHISDGKNKTICRQVDIYQCLQDIISLERNFDLNDGRIKLVGAVKKELEDFRMSREYIDVWATAYRRYSRIDKFKNIEVFICGGGSEFPYLNETFSTPWWDAINVKYPVRKLPLPDDYDGSSCNAPFDRMAVAYGLTIPKPQLDKFVLPDDVQDFEMVKPQAIEIDHEDIYSEK